MGDAAGQARDSAHCGASGRVHKIPGGRSKNLTAGASHVITAENAGCGALWLGYPWWG